MRIEVGCHVSGFVGPKKPRERPNQKDLSLLQMLVDSGLFGGTTLPSVPTTKLESGEHNCCLRDAAKTKFAQEISPSEFWVFQAVVFAARIHGRQGNITWEKHDPDGRGVCPPP